MKALILFIGLGLAAIPQAPRADDAEGRWVGMYRTGEGIGNVDLTIENVDGEWQATMVTTSVDHPEETPDPLSGLEVTEGQVAFTIHWGPTETRWTGVIDGDTITGELVSDHFRGEWEATRADGTDAP